MGRIILAAAAAAAVLCLATAPSMRAQAQGFYPVETCVFPPWYPRGWELMVRCPPSYYQPYYPRRASYRYRVARHYASVHRRPYLRPGWWW